MRLPSRLGGTPVGVVVALIAVCLLGLAAFAARRPGAHGSAIGLPRSATLGHLEAAQERVVAARERWLASPAARAQRAASAMAFDGLRPAAARRLFAREFHGDVARVSASPASSRAVSGRVVRYLGAASAVVRTPQGLRVAYSSVPLVARDRRGAVAPVDLSVRRVPGGFAPANPVSPLAIGARLADGVWLGGSGVGLTMVGRDVPGVLVGSLGVFFAGMGRDVDASVVPTIDGAEMFAVLRSRLSPERLWYRLTLPVGAVVRPDAGGAVVFRGGRMIAAVPAPMAVDAQGQSVSTRLVVSGGRLLLTVAHRSASVAYPVLVDPAPVDPPPSPGWSWSLTGQTGNGTASTVGPGEIGMVGNSLANENIDACWQWTPPQTGSSYDISYVEADNVALSVAPSSGPNNPINTNPFSWSIQAGQAPGCVAPPSGDNVVPVIGGFSEGPQSPPASVATWSEASASPVSVTDQSVSVEMESTGNPYAGFNPATAMLSVGAILVEAPYLGSGHTPISQYSGSQSPLGAPSPPEGYGGNNPSERNIKHCIRKDPVDCATGNYFMSQTDLSIPGRGAGIALTRTYNSQLAAGQSAPGPFGYGWTSSYSAHLVVNASAGTATVYQDNGSTVPFLDNAGTFTPAGGWIQSALVANANGTYTFTLPDQTVLNFSSTGALTSESDRDDNVTSLTYNASGQLSTITDSAGRTITLSYNANGTVSQAQDSTGRLVKYGYDSAGDLSSVTDVASTAWSFTYDGSHEMLTVVDPRNGTLTNTYTAGQVTKQVDPAGRTTQWAYSSTSSGTQTVITDPLGNTTTEQFNFAGEPTQVARASNTSYASTTNYGYDVDWDLVSVTDPNGNLTTYGYDDYGNLVSEVQPLGRTSAWTYDALHDVLSYTDPAGHLTTMTYSANGDLDTVSRTLTETGQAQTWTYTHANSGHPGDVTAITDPLQRVTSLAYDQYGDLASVTSPKGNETTYTYNALGQRTAMVTARGNVSGGNPSSYKTTYTYDAYGDMLTAADPLGTQTWTYDPDRNLASYTDRDNRKTQYAYDADNELTTVTRPDATTAVTGYDANGDVTSQSNGKTPATTYTYNALGEVTATTDPLGRQTSFSYDADGNQTAKQDAALRTTTFGYDADSELTSVSYSSGSPSAVAYTYNADGQRTQMTDASGTTTYTYDSLGRLTGQTDAASQTTTYGYDLDNEVTTIGYPTALGPVSGSGSPVHVATGTVTRTYDTDGNLASVADWLGHTTTFTYDPEDDMTGVTRPNATSATYSYDADNNMTALSDVNGTVSLGRTAQGLLQSSTPQGGSAQTYGYDADGRLEAVGSDNTAYQYDPANDPIQTTVNGGTVTQTFDAADELTAASATPLTNGGPVSYAYDSEGERTSSTPQRAQATSYAYDQAGDLTTVTPKHSQTTVAGGRYHSLVLRDDGTVWATGYNNDGQLGNGTTKNSSQLVQVQGVGGVQKIAAGYFRSLAIENDGSVWAWGQGDLGNATTTNSSTAIQVPGVSGAAAVASGVNQSLVLLSGGTVEAWGANTYGEDGNGTTTAQTSPVAVSGLSGVTQIAAGAYHSLALKSNGTVWAWGDNSNGQLGNNSTTNSSTPVQVQGLSNVTAIAAGQYFSLALESNGTVWAWGANSSGQLGDGNTTDSHVPVQVTGVSGISQISAGLITSYAMTSSGTVMGWGDNSLDELGALGGGSTAAAIPGISSATQIAAGSLHLLGIQTNGEGFALGLNLYGQLGSGSTTSAANPQPLPGVGAAQPMTAGGRYHSLVLRDDGTVWASGENNDGQLGNGTTKNSSTFVEVPGLGGIQKIAAGYYRSLAIDSNGWVWAWGQGDLGDGATDSTSTPQVVPGLSGATQVASGVNQSLVLLSGGTVEAWGANTYGEDGNGTTTAQTSPVAVSGLSGVTQIAAGAYHSLALKSNGTVWAWGDNSNGQLGNNSTTNSSTPVQVQGLSNVTAIAAGQYFSLALESNGTVWAWGANSSGQLGDGNTTDSHVPVQVTGVSGISQISAGLITSYAMTSSGTVMGWGDNSLGELGALGGGSTAAAIPGISSATQIAAGSLHLLGIQTNGSTIAVGLNLYGQLGDGTTATAYSPEYVPSLTSVYTHARPPSTYTYNGDGLRQAKTVNNTTTTAAYDLSGALPLQIEDGPNAYIYGPNGVPIEEITSDRSTHWFSQDQQGSTTAVTDINDNQEATYTYDPYGNPTQTSGTWQQPFLYNGQYTDPETGLQYLRNRYYDPSTGQFLTEDPLQAVTGQPYNYAADDPLNQNDPAGLSPGQGNCDGPPAPTPTGTSPFGPSAPAPTGTSPFGPPDQNSVGSAGATGAPSTSNLSLPGGKRLKCIIVSAIVWCGTHGIGDTAPESPPDPEPTPPTRTFPMTPNPADTPVVGFCDGINVPVLGCVSVPDPSSSPGPSLPLVGPILAGA